MAILIGVDMAEGLNLALLFAEAVLYFALMTCLLHFRHRIGLGVFLTALGVMHFVETYLAAVFYIQVPFGVVSPGSSVFFAGKLMMILMLYIKEDASTVRQPIYGLFLGNLVTLLVAQLVLLHHPAELGNAQQVNSGFLQDMGLLMLWGTALLYLDSLGIILLFERLRRILPGWTVLRLALSGYLVLTFDQLGFYALLHYLYDAPLSVFWGGWIAKMLAATVYAALFGLYQIVFSDFRAAQSRRPIRDIFSDLTFRERYEDLLARTGRDVLTGLFDRSRMELEAPWLIRESLRNDKPATLAIVDIDHFKSINDRFGHIAGDHVLRAVAECMRETIRQDDRVFRYGGEEFVLLFAQTSLEDARLITERLRQNIAAEVKNPAGEPVTVSGGIAAAPEDGANFNALLTVADARLYKAKRGGRDRVAG